MERVELLSSDGLIIRLQEIFQDVELYKKLVRCQGPGVQKVLDSFQQLLDSPSLGGDFRRRLIIATQRISKRSGLYPTCYELKGITIEGLHPIGAGDFADIFKGDFEGQQVCLKAIKIYQNRDVEHFLKKVSKEAVLWCQLSHPNLLPMYGLFRFQERPCFVSPWMSAGDITQYLRYYPQVARLPLVIDVAEGLAYLHRNEIIHGDLKGPNILVDDAGIAYVADFGLSSVSDTEIPVWTSHSAAASTGGSTRWQAPELFDIENNMNMKNTKASDVYAWSFVCYEAYTSNIPFSHIKQNIVVMLCIMRGTRPTRPADASPPWRDWGLNENIWSVMETCWSADPLQRPTIEHVISLLKPQLSLDNRMGKQNSTLSPMRFRNKMGGDFVMTVKELDELLDNPAPLLMNEAVAKPGTPDLSEDLTDVTLSPRMRFWPSDSENATAGLTSTPDSGEPNTPAPGPSPQPHRDSEVSFGANRLPTLIPEPTKTHTQTATAQPSGSEYKIFGHFKLPGKTKTHARKSWTGKGLLQENDSIMEDGCDTDVVILVMGPTGAGKSTFINTFDGCSASVGHGLSSHTEKVEQFIIRHPRDLSRRLVLVDTPGFDNTDVGDSEILRRIAVWLAKCYSDNLNIAGIVYLHEITRSTFKGFSHIGLEVLMGLCGPRAISNVTLVTTKWDEVSPEVHLTCPQLKAYKRW